DERIPSMCYLVFDNPRALTKGDMTRIGLLDDQGSPDTLPYSRPFLADFDEQYCFDAFWGPRTPKAARCEATMAGQPSAPAPWWTTRYMCCGYGFTVLGCDDQGKFFTNEENGVYFHFDHHYFKIGLIAHFHRASLLMFSERLSNAVKVLDPGPRGPDPDRYKKLRKEVQTIQDDFLRFRSRYWFTEVSNHLQPRILFDLWSRHLNTRELFAEVLDEAQTINDVLDAREQEKQTAESVRLSVVATVGLAASIAVNSFALYGVKNCEGFTEFSLVVAILIYVGAFLVIAFSGPLGATFKKLAGEGEKQWKDRASGGTALESPQPVPSHSFTTDQQQ
ncbi:MAG TPA: hypothetical protein VKA15_22615, partial [Isosphaeraceae bacterium]|nr:hypothetical protein [Isosphaeraceae bacterium]